jgi:hypothetical protein
MIVSYATDPQMRALLSFPGMPAFRGQRNGAQRYANRRAGARPLNRLGCHLVAGITQPPKWLINLLFFENSGRGRSRGRLELIYMR